jgi:hypothetical protein
MFLLNQPLLFDKADYWEDRFLFSHWNNNVSVRNQNYILDKDNQIFDLLNDPGQTDSIIDIPETIHSKLINAKKEWINTVLGELDLSRSEVFPVGYEDSRYTHLPARDGSAHGNIKRSNRFPNASHFTNWTSINDSISWNCEILTSGKYRATVYLTNKESSIGSTFVLKQGINNLMAQISEVNDSPFVNVEFDRFNRQESFEKEFKPLEMGIIDMDKGLSTISLKADKIMGEELMEFRLLTLERIIE